MSWVLFSQVSGWMVLAALLGVAVHGSVVDKRREDAYKRKENGL